MLGVAAQIQSFASNNRLLDKIYKHFSLNIQNSKPAELRTIPDIHFYCILDPEAECYIRAERISSMVSRAYSVLISVGAIMPSVPLLQTLYRVFVQEMSLENHFILPIVCSFPFKVNSWPRYSACFVWTYGCFITLVIAKLIVAPVMFTLCFYVIADMQYLQSTSGRLDRVEWVLWSGSRSFVSDSHVLKSHMQEKRRWKGSTQSERVRETKHCPVSVGFHSALAPHYYVSVLTRLFSAE